MRYHKLTSGLDKLGMTTSTLCALHCLFMPLLLTVLPFAGLAYLMQPWIDIAMIAAGLLIGLVSLGISYSHHRRGLPILLLIAGFVVIIAVHLTHGHTETAHAHHHPDHTLSEMIFLFAGGLSVAAAHFVNWRYNACPFPSE